MLGRRSLATVSAVGLLVCLSLPAGAQNQASEPPKEDESGGLFGPLPSQPASRPMFAEGTPRWRRLAFGVASGAAGLGLIAGLSFKVVETQKYREFNAFVRPGGGDGPDDRCLVSAPRSGPPGCAELLAEGKTARRRAYIAFGSAGALAVTALVLKLTEREAGSPRAATAPTLACAPAPAAATCRLTF